MIFNLSFSYIGVIISILIALIYTGFLYYKDQKLSHINKFALYSAAFIRFLVVFIIAILLFSPIFKTISTQYQKPKIIFLFDNSKSIVASNKFDQKNIEKIIEYAKKHKSGNHEIIFKTFDEKLNDTFILNFNGNKTNISQALTDLYENNINENLGCIVLISDGIFNSGPSPLTVLNKIPLPIYTIGLGDTTQIADAFISQINYNKTIFLNNQFPIEISCIAKNLVDKKLKVNIYEKDQLLFTNESPINSNSYLYKTVFYYKAIKPGIIELTIEIEPIDSEKNKNNNKQKIAIEVKEKKENILIVANSPHPDIAAICNALKNADFEIDILYPYNFSINKNYVFAILHNIPSTTTTGIISKINQLSIPYLIIIGTQTDLKTLKTYPIGATIPENYNPENAYGYVNSNFKDFDISEDLQKLLTYSPALQTIYGKIKLSSSAKSIINQEIKNVKTDQPLIFVNQLPNYKIGIIYGENIWRWRVYSYKIFKKHDVFDEFFINLVNYLISSNIKNPFIVNIPSINSNIDDIIITAQAINEAGQLTNTNDALISIFDSLKNEYSFKFDKYQNFYKLNIGKLPVGKYTYKAETAIGEKKYTTAGQFSVIPFDYEKTNLTADFDILEQIGLNTKSKFFTLKNFDSLFIYLAKDERILTKSYESLKINDITDFKIIFFLIILLASIEWLLRKIFGTI